MDEVMNLGNLNKDSTATVVEFVQKVCTHHATFLPSKLFRFNLLGNVQPYFCLSTGTLIADMFAKNAKSGKIAAINEGFCKALEDGSLQRRQTLIQ